MSEGEKDEFVGLRKALEKYSYIDDVLNEVKGLSIQLDRYRPKIEFLLRRRDVTLRTKNQLIESLSRYHKEVENLVRELKKNIKGMTATEKRLKLQRLIDLIRRMFKEIDEYEGV